MQGHGVEALAFACFSAFPSSFHTMSYAGGVEVNPEGGLSEEAAESFDVFKDEGQVSTSN